MKFKNIQNNTTAVGSTPSVAIKNTESLYVRHIMYVDKGTEYTQL